MKHKTYNIKNTKKEKQKNCSMFHVPCSMKQKGFSVIELVFVLAIFLIIVGVTVDIFISMVQHQRRILAEQELLNQTSYVMEYMSKALRMAVKDTTGSCLGIIGFNDKTPVYSLTHCPIDPLKACNGVKFINQSDNNACEEFFLLGGKLQQIKNNSPAQNILSDKFKIKYARFVVDGNQTLRFAAYGDLVQPIITILLDIQNPSVLNQQEKIIQTTVSQRNLNI